MATVGSAAYKNIASLFERDCKSINLSQTPALERILSISALNVRFQLQNGGNLDYKDKY